MFSGTVRIPDRVRASPRAAAAQPFVRPQEGCNVRLWAFILGSKLPSPFFSRAFLLLTQGPIALALLRQQAHQHLGFIRLGDYTRERLGLSAREIQSFAQVVHTMEQLPLIAGAFARAELSWTQVRAVVRVATQATEASWLARARGLTVRVLEDLVRDACGGGSTAEGPPAGAPPVSSEAIVTPAALTAAAAAVADEDAGRIDGEPAVRLRLRCPRRVRWPVRNPQSVSAAASDLWAAEK